MPIVTMDILKGRTVEQKRNMVHKVTDVLVETLNCTPEAVQIIIHEIEPIHIAKGGILQSDK
jgi:4-oxalocrotonate tautomerase family enzyme